MDKIKIPKRAKLNAQMAISANYLLKKNSCATLVGKRRANQILSNDYLSITTAKRTFSYLSRARTYNNNDWTSCGTISFNLWGGEEMLKYLQKKFLSNEKQTFL